MKTLLVHLSDMHLKPADNNIFEKQEHIFKVFQNEALEMDNVFLVVSGDIAFAGLSDEYNHAMELIDGIKMPIEDYTNKKVYCVMIPGNHDCNHEIKNKRIRETLIEGIQQKRNVCGEFIDQCCEVQKNCFELLELYQDATRVIHSDNLLRIPDYQLGDFNIIFYCYNTAWMSQVPEQPVGYGVSYGVKSVMAVMGSSLLLTLMLFSYGVKSALDSYVMGSYQLWGQVCSFSYGVKSALDSYVMGSYQLWGQGYGVKSALDSYVMGSSYLF